MSREASGEYAPRRDKSVARGPPSELANSPVEDCYGFSDYMCYTIAQILDQNKHDKAKVIAAWWR